MTNFEKWIGSLKTVDDFVRIYQSNYSEKYLDMYCDRCPANKSNCNKEDCKDHFIKWGNEINLDVSDKKIQEIIDSINDFEPVNNYVLSNDALDALQYAFQIKKELEEDNMEIKIGDKVKLHCKGSNYPCYDEIFQENKRFDLICKYTFIRNSTVDLDVVYIVIAKLKHSEETNPIYVLLNEAIGQIYLNSLDEPSYFEIIKDEIKQETKDKIQERLEYLKNKKAEQQPKNLILEIVKLLGVELGEKFTLTTSTNITGLYCFKENGLFDERGSNCPYVLARFLAGDYKLNKIPLLTKEQAYQEIVRIIAKFNDDWKPDWQDEYQRKHHFWLSRKSNQLNVGYKTQEQSLPNELYLKSEPSNKILEKLELLYKIYLGVI